MSDIVRISLIVCFIFNLTSCGENDENSGSSSSSETTTNTTLSAPSDVSATLGYYQVSLDWTAVSGASSYIVYWGSSTGISSSSSAITGITDDNYSHTGLDNGTPYYYKVATVNSVGTGDLSTEVNTMPRDAHTVTESCTSKETASGTLQGVKGTGPSGTFYHSWYGSAPSNGCITADDNVTNTFSQILPSDSKSVKHALVITNDGDGFTDTWHFYSDTDCSIETGFISKSYNNLETSDNITISNPPSGYPKEATKVTYEDYYNCYLAETDTVESKIESLYSISLTKGTVSDIAAGGDDLATIWTVLDNISGQTINWFYTEDASDNSSPSNFSSNGGTTWHAGDNISR